MTKYFRRRAFEVGLRVGYHRGFEKHGRTFLTTYDCDAVGGQCSKCYAIVWTSSRRNALLRQPKPDDVPSSGPGYTKFVMENRSMFLRSLSPCPQCNAVGSFDLFVTNITPTRYEDGTEEVSAIDKEYYDTPNLNEAWVWWADFDDNETSARI